MLSGANEQSIKALVLYAQSSGKYLGGMDAIAARARFISQSERRERAEFGDVKRAIQESVTPSDEALKAAIGASQRTSRRQVASVFAAPLQAPGRPAEMTPSTQRELVPADLSRGCRMELEHV